MMERWMAEALDAIAMALDFLVEHLAGGVVLEEG